ncbi:MAG: ATP-dependent Clp protease proteolytic subunit [Lachnospiraceae bacterium]|nr:ATP-dependent Clp protease proteolytic subunit [Lachnospiraceae bacterium]
MINEVIIPCILKETSTGYIRHPIQDEMLKNREIECVGDINETLANSLIMQLRYLQKEEPKKEITMYINSKGGEVSSGLALYDAMQAVSCPIRTVCVGMAASMGAVLFTAGKKREMLPHARVMIHDPLMTDGVSGSALRIDDIGKNLMKTRETLGKILVKHTGRELSEVFEKTAKDSYFDAEEAVAFGLADRIINKI